MKPQEIHKNNTFSNFSNHKLSNWFSSLGFIHTKRKPNHLKSSKSLSKLFQAFIIYLLNHDLIVYAMIKCEKKQAWSLVGMWFPNLLVKEHDDDYNDDDVDDVKDL